MPLNFISVEPHSLIAVVILDLTLSDARVGGIKASFLGYKAGHLPRTGSRRRGSKKRGAAMDTAFDENVEIPKCSCGQIAGTPSLIGRGCRACTECGARDVDFVVTGQRR